MASVAELANNTITLHDHYGTGESCLDFDFGQKRNKRVFLGPDRSRSLKYDFVGPTELSCNTWVIFAYEFYKESGRHYKIYSALSDWLKEDKKTPSLMNENRLQLLLESWKCVDEDWSEKRIKLNQKYLKEKDRYLHYFKGIQVDFIDKVFKSTLEKIIRLPYAGIALEITPDKSIFFEMRFEENITIHFKLILSDPAKTKAFFALYRNSKCEDNGVGTIDDILNHLLKIRHGGISVSSVTQTSL